MASEASPGPDAPAGPRTETAWYWPHAAVPGVDLLRARYVTHRYARHAHETYTLALIEDGVEEFSHDGVLLRAPSGSVALLNPEVAHTGHAGVPEGWAYRVLYPAVDVVAGIAAELGAPRGTPYFPQTVVADPDSARLIRAAHRAAEHGDRLAASSLLHTALAALLRAHALPAFRAETGMPPHAYLNQLRVRQARVLLDAGVPPAEAAATTGFADQAHLTRHFKRVVGVPPGAFQRARGAVRQ
jgi:AraC-like DNA-binding protein